MDRPGHPLDYHTVFGAAHPDHLSLDLDALIEDLLLMARADARTPRRPLEAVDLRALVEGEVERLGGGVTISGEAPALDGDALLLRHLVRSEGRVVSRKEILEEVWGLHEDTDTRAIDNFMVRLRRYIEDDPAQPRHLLTVRGVGYRFVANPEKK